MIEVVLEDYEANTILSIVAQLKEQGYQVDKDFIFHYHPPRWDFFTDSDYHKRTVFSFADHNLATWFSLKYKQ